jgi:hypothetical protein
VIIEETGNNGGSEEMRERGMWRAVMVLVLVVATAVVLVAGCLDDKGGTYCCRYEERHTGCGGAGWSDWEKATFSFNIDDYKEGWTPERICDQYSGSDTSCGGGCCISIQYRNNQLSGGSCS